MDSIVIKENIKIIEGSEAASKFYVVAAGEGYLAAIRWWQFSDTPNQINFRLRLVRETEGQWLSANDLAEKFPKVAWIGQSKTHRSISESGSIAQVPVYGEAFKEKMKVSQCIQSLYVALTDRMPTLTFVPVETLVALAQETISLVPEPEVTVVEKPKKEGVVVKLVHKDAQDCGLG